MSDRVFDAFRNCISEPKCRNCPWKECEEMGNKKVEIPADLALAVMNRLKEQEDKIYELAVELGSAKELAEGYAELLKEHEPKTYFSNGYEVTRCGVCKQVIKRVIHSIPE